MFTPTFCRFIWFTIAALVIATFSWYAVLIASAPVRHFGITVMDSIDIQRDTKFKEAAQRLSNRLPDASRFEAEINRFGFTCDNHASDEVHRSCFCYQSHPFIGRRWYISFNRTPEGRAVVQQAGVDEWWGNEPAEWYSDCVPYWP